MVYRFDRFEVDDTVFRLSADGVAVPLEPKALRLLLYLLQNRGRLVRKQELLDAVWAEAAVAESVLTRLISMLRKALDDDSREPKFIETVPTAGYRFIAKVQIVEGGSPVGAAEAAQGSEVGVESRSRPHWLWVTAGVILLLILAAGSWFAAERSHPRPVIHSLAVLPLANLSGDSTQDYFADGMTDELITELAHIPNLRVVSRTSVMLEKSAGKPLPQIARELGVDAIVEGSTVRSGDRVRITAQLIDARTDHHLWAQSFEGSASDILGLQDSVAQEIASRARLALLPAAPRPKVNAAAEDAYLRGKYFFNKQDEAHSLEYFERAISLDPNYAAAYAGYATVLDASTAFGLARPVDAMPKALDAAQHAIELDPNNGDAYTELGSIQTIYSWDWTAAEQNLTRGISLNPNDSLAEFKYAVYLDAVGRPQDAIAHMKRALELDPMSFLVNRRLGATLYLAREYDAALAQLQRAAEMEQQPGTVENYLSLIYEQKGQRDEAVQHDLLALNAEQPKLDIDALGLVFQQKGWQAYWRARSERLLAASPVPCTAYEVGVDDVRVHDFDGAFAAFQHAIDAHCFYMALVRVDPLLDPVRKDARYSDVLKRINQ